MFHASARLARLLAAPLLLGALSSTPCAAAEPVPVVLLHGLARSASSMNTIGRALEREGYRVCNIAYPSREYSIEVLAREHVAPAVVVCTGSADQPVHFVTHSMGGIVVRQLAASNALTQIQRVLMLAPPNHGSELIDVFGGLRTFAAVSGPAGRQLNTSTDSAPKRLGPPPFELGVIAGTRSVNLLLSLRIPGPDDGKVSVASARLEGARDFIALPVSHPFVLLNGESIAQTLHFLREGRFRHAAN